MKKTYLESAFDCIKEKHNEALKQALANPNDERLFGEANGLAYAFGVVAGALELEKKEKEDIKKLQKAFEDPEGLEFGDTYIEEDTEDEKGN